MKKHVLTCILLGVFTFSLFSQTSPIRINQVGYEVNGPKTAVYQSDKDESGITSFKILNSSNQEVHSGSVTKADTVDGWVKIAPFETIRFFFWTMDFSDFKEPGTYTIECNGKESFEFEIGTNLYFPKCIGPQLDCFEEMRYTGNEDKNLPVEGTSQTVDLYGGYREASGDDSKHMSHLQYANYMSTSEIPICTWALLRSYELNKKLIDSLNLKDKLFEEIAWGCDYMVKAKAPNKSFYTTVFNGWELFDRKVTSYEVLDIENDVFEFHENVTSAFREGGGIGIAALAKTYKMGISSSDNTSEDFLNTAKETYDELKANNTTYCHDGKENIIDDYTALMAAIDMYKATEDNKYKTDAGSRVDKLIGRQDSKGHFWCDDAKNRPYFHAGEEGLPILALIYYMEIDNSKDAAIKSAVKKAIDWYLEITEEVNNPFNYVRLIAKTFDPVNEVYKQTRKMFFMPKDSNETRYWFQGENARLGSMTTAILNAAQVLDDNWKLGKDNLSRLALDQLNWILGKNPFEICMFYGQGKGIGTKYNPAYSGGRNFVGGICNGITGSMPTSIIPTGIEWMPADNTNPNTAWRNWRWLEQWLPHEAWFFLATATLSNIVRGSQTGIIEDNNKTIVQVQPITLKATPAGSNIQITLSKPINESMKLTLIDLKGRAIKSIKLNAGVTKGLINRRNISSGVHVIELSNGRKSVVRQKVQLF